MVRGAKFVQLEPKLSNRLPAEKKEPHPLVSLKCQSSASLHMIPGLETSLGGHAEGAEMTDISGYPVGQPGSQCFSPSAPGRARRWETLVTNPSRIPLG